MTLKGWRVVKLQHNQSIKIFTKWKSPSEHMYYSYQSAWRSLVHNGVHSVHWLGINSIKYCDTWIAQYPNTQTDQIYKM